MATFKVRKRKILHGRHIAEDGRSPPSFTSPPSLVPPHFGSRQCPGPQYPSNMAHMSQWLERDSESSGAWKRRTTGGIPWRFQEAREGDAFHWVTGYIRHADRGLEIIASRASVFVWVIGYIRHADRGLEIIASRASVLPLLPCLFLGQAASAPSDT